MEIPFIKMEANGNSYLLILDKSINKNLNLENLTAKMSSKNYGVGSDGALIISNTYRPIPYVEIYNNDGTKANLCVNGLRIVSRYLFDTLFKNKDTIKVKTDSGIYEAKCIDNSIIIKVKIENTYNEENYYFNNKKYRLLFLDIGNNHVYIMNDNSINLNYFKNNLGKEISLRFNANVGLITPTPPLSFSIITYERGSKLTQSCGSNICGAAYILKENEMIQENETITVETLGGNLTVRVEDDIVYYQGETNLICKGTYYL